jgi:NADH-quinone oxidoreductase subunit C
MPDESKGPDSVSPPNEGAKAPVEAAVPEKTEVKPPETKAVAAEAKALAAGAPAAAPEAKPAVVAKPATPAATKPAAPAVAAKPMTPTAAAKPAAATAPKPPAAPAKPAGPVPEPWQSELVTRLRRQYGSGIIESLSYLGQKYLTVDTSILTEILMRMRDEEGFDYCVDITAVHYPKRDQQFDIVYVLYSFPKNERIRVKTKIADGQHVPTAVGLWETANWLEREAFDMFGIIFDGHPGLKRILLPDEWKGHPLRKDYDILKQDQEWVKINLGIESGQ